MVSGPFHELYLCFMLQSSEHSGTFLSAGMNWIAPYLSEASGHSSDTWNTILQFLDRWVTRLVPRPFFSGSGYTILDACTLAPEYPPLPSLTLIILRCHQIGVRVHYDLHQLATLPDTATKWQLLQTEVKMVMDHPAVVA